MKIKGFILHSRKEFVIDNFGIDAWKKVLDALPMEDQKLYEGFIPTSDWYDFEIGKRVDEAIFNLLGEGSSEQFEDIGPLHVLTEKAQELVSADWTPENPAGKEPGVAFHTHPVHRRTGQGGGVDVRALEPFVPIAPVVNDAAVDVLLP